jgi:hypothetical protein
MYAIWHQGIRASYDALQQIIMSILLHRLDRKQISWDLGTHWDVAKIATAILGYQRVLSVTKLPTLS